MTGRVVREEIARAYRQYADALARHDAEAMAVCYDADGVVLAPNAQPVAGMDGIRAYCEGLCALPYELTLDGFTVEHAIASENYVIEVSCFTGASVPLGKPYARIVTTSTTLMVWRYRNGRWLIVRQMYGPIKS